MHPPPRLRMSRRHLPVDAALSQRVKKPVSSGIYRGKRKGAKTGAQTSPLIKLVGVASPARCAYVDTSSALTTRHTLISDHEVRYSVNTLSPYDRGRPMKGATPAIGHWSTPMVLLQRSRNATCAAAGILFFDEMDSIARGRGGKGSGGGGSDVGDRSVRLSARFVPTLLWRIHSFARTFPGLFACLEENHSVRSVRSLLGVDVARRVCSLLVDFDRVSIAVPRSETCCPRWTVSQRE